MHDLLSDLNDQQREAVCHAAGPLLVVAGPGSGKTRVLTRRLAHRVQEGGVPPHRLLAITFTNRAAEEMKSRVAALLGQSVPVHIGTFHWMCNALLRRHAHVLGYRRDFRLLTPAEARQVMREALRSAGETLAPARGAAVSAVSAWKNGASTKDAASRCGLSEEVLLGLIGAYGSALRSINALDLDDLLGLSLQLLEENEAVREACRKGHEEIVVDEYQDVNPVQNRVVQLLTPSSRTVVAVGDEDQAIYGWRQADIESILRFPTDFPDARIVRLEESYRCTKHILRAARSLVEHNRNRMRKSLFTQNPAGTRPECFVANDELEEADWLAAEARRLVEVEGRRWTDFAVLYRTNAQSRALEDALVRHDIPYHINAGHRFYDRWEIRAAAAYLRLALDPRDDDAAAHLLGSLPGIGPRRSAAVRERAHDLDLDYAELLARPEAALSLPRSLFPALRELGRRLNALHACRELSLQRVVDVAAECVEGDLEGLSAVVLESARESLGELRTMVRELDGGRGTLRGFVDRLIILEGEGQRKNGMALMSLHAAKGLEFQVVFLAGLEEGLLPHRRSLEDASALEEERRLCYVGMTRAQHRLYLSYAHARMLGGQALMGNASRFIGEIGEAHLTRRVSPKRRTVQRLETIRPGERVMHARWKAGTVVDVEGRGRDTLVTILFDLVGRQRLQLCYAPLQRLKEESRDALAG